MISKNDLMLLLTELETTGVDINNQLIKLMRSPDIPLDIVKFINDKRPLDVANFYELLRKNYNNKKSPLYKNLVREEFKQASDVLSTLAALNLQIILYANKLKDSKLFLAHSRAEEIAQALAKYYQTYDLIPCYKLLKLIKCDLHTFESLKN